MVSAPAVGMRYYPKQGLIQQGIAVEMTAVGNKLLPVRQLGTRKVACLDSHQDALLLSAWDEKRSTNERIQPVPEYTAPQPHASHVRPTARSAEEQLKLKSTSHGG